MPAGAQSKLRSWWLGCGHEIRPAIDEVWRLGAVGFDEDGRAVDYERVVTPEEWIAELLRRNLTVTSTTFNVRDVTQAVAARLGDGATVTTIERMVALVIADPQVLTVVGDDGERRYTSRELHDVEQRYVDVVAAKASDGLSMRRWSQRRSPSASRWAPTRRHAVNQLCASASRAERADRPGRDRQDVHARHRPRRLRAGRVAGHWRRPVGPGRSGAGDREHRSRRARCTPYSVTSNGD